jgi:aspartokinase
MDKMCSDCGKPLHAKNTSGLCRAHALAAARRDPAVQQRRVERLAEAKRTPEMRQQSREVRLKLNAERANDPEWQDMMRECGKRLRAALLSDPKHEAKRKARQRQHQESLLAWCPEEFRDTYRKIRREVGAAEARRMIKADIARAEARRLAALSPLERQLERLQAGAKLTPKFRPKPTEHDFTLGGIASGLL